MCLNLFFNIMTCQQLFREVGSLDVIMWADVKRSLNSFLIDRKIRIMNCNWLHLSCKLSFVCGMTNDQHPELQVLWSEWKCQYSIPESYFPATSTSGIRQWHHICRLSASIQVSAWAEFPRTSQKLCFSRLPNQHGTTWAVTMTVRWADCFWECTCIAS